MPIYTFKHRDTDEVIEKILPMDEREEFLNDNPEYKQILGSPNIVHERGTNLKVPDSFRETLSKVKETYKINNIKSY